MSKGRALVVAVDEYRVWDPSGRADLPRACGAGKKSAGVLAEHGLEVEMAVNPSGKDLLGAFTRLVQQARREGQVPWLVFVGSGATRRDGALVLCASDTDRTLEGAVLLDELAWRVAHEGPPRMVVALDCGFTGIREADEPVRTLTPHARVDPRRRIFRRADVVLARPLDAAVLDEELLVDQAVPIEGVLFQIHGSNGGGFMDVRLPGRDLLGHLQVFPEADPSVPPPFLADREYWFWRPGLRPWPERFTLRRSDDPPFGPPTPAAWLAFEHAPFGATSLVGTEPRGRCFRIVRQPAGVEAGFLELREDTGRITGQIWYGVPGQVDLDGFFLFGEAEQLEFTALPEPHLSGRTLHVVVTPRRFDTA
jgi:hypothetical protein